jgi:glycosyltransferase involved in cell wall biosynthesis
MPSSKMPFMSIVVITYNGEAALASVLESLIQQTYPKDSYEIVLVDDGSTDSTPLIVANYPEVSYLRLETNQGISAARNAGLQFCHGEIYVNFDDDCIADSNWLEKLAEVYRQNDTIGVGGTLIMPESNAKLISRYLSMCDFYVGIRQDYTDETHLRPLLRLWRYLKAGFHSDFPESDLIEVNELYGANSSFPKKILQDVGGWQPKMSGIEDRDISYRIRLKYPGHSFHQTSAAKLMHSGSHSFSQYFMRPLRRGPMNLRFYKSIGQTPPVFPFPILYILVCLSAYLVPFYWLIISLFSLPLVLYFWWPVRAFRHRQFSVLVFAYFQLLEETVVMLGLVRSYLNLSVKDRRLYGPQN